MSENSYLDLMQDILETGNFIENDRTGVGIYSKFGATLRFDLQKGFPALTTKKLAWRAVVGELLWFLEGSSNVERLREITWGPGSTKRTIWDDNYENQGKALGYTGGDLGPVYGKQHRSIYSLEDTVVFIEPREGSERPIATAIEETLLLRPEVGCGETFTNKSNTCTVLTIKKVSKQGEKNSKYLVQDTDTLETFEATRPNLRSGAFNSPIKKATNNTLGTLADITLGPDKKHIYDLWYNMVSRCLNPAHPQYKTYGGAGVTVCSRWLRLSNFIRDISDIPGYYLWLDNPGDYSLDKDYYGSKTYSKATCIFLDKKTNIGLSNKKEQDTYYQVQDVTTRKVLKESVFLKPLSTEYALPAETVRTHLNDFGVYENAEFRVLKLKAPEGLLARPLRVIDQIQNLIDDINKSKESGVHNRRLLVSAWNPPELDKMALPPCHYAFQLYYLNGELSLMWHQRSVDLFIGAPFNIASYALLLHILAQITGTKAKELIFTGGDTHIYANHFDQCMEQLSREPYTPPELIMPVFNTLEEVLQIPVDCFELENYKSHPTIKAPMAV